MAHASIPVFGVAVLGAIALALPIAPKSTPEPTAAAQAMPTPSGNSYRRVAVLGIDGLDPELLEETITKFPDRTRNFQKLIAQGGIHDLGTSCPPQSPVAWSNFITGRNPGGHGVFDFIHRDTVTRAPLPGSVKSEHASSIDLWGDWKFPIGGESVSNRSGESFWVTLAKHGVPADVWRMPANFPVEPAEGVSFCGMMTPALDSAYGTYTVYSSDPPSKTDRSGGKYVNVRVNQGCYVRTDIEGPPNSFKKGDPHQKATLEFHIDAENQAVAVDTGLDVVILQPGEWSDFVTVEFELLPLDLMNISGICRFYLRSIEPKFELYASPVNIDPVNPVMPVSEPVSASGELVDAIGLYYTQGMAEEVNALKDEAIDDLEFVTQTKLIYDQRVRMMDYALDKYLAKEEGGFFFFYYSTIDLNCHMLWRYYDEGHPQHPKIAERAAQGSVDWSGREGSTWQEVIYDWYLMMDPIVGTMMDRLPDDTLFVVMSDHGFATYRRTFSLNRWLVDNGYMVLRDEVSDSSGSLTIFPPDPEHPEKDPGAVDWTRTRAYGMGFNGLYLNLEGREEDIPGTKADESGIVKPGEARALLEEIKAKLEAERDQGERSILVADITTDVYSGERMKEAPDIQIGFNAGWGNSDASSTGMIPSSVYADNMGGSFNGNHLMAPEVVAGILMTNGVVRPGEHALEDLTVDILEKYGIKPIEGQNGHPVIE